MKELMEALKKFKLLSKVEFIILFGSVSKKKQTPLSDIDFCLSLHLPAKERARIRMKLLGTLPEKYDIQIFEDLPLYIQKEVLGGKVIYCKNKKKLIERALSVIQDYEDFKPIYEYYIAKDKSSVEI